MNRIVLALGFVAHASLAGAQALPLGGGPVAGTTAGTTSSETTRKTVHHGHTTTTETTKVTRQASGHAVHRTVIHDTTVRTVHPHHTVKETTSVVRHDSHVPPHHAGAHHPEHVPVPVHPPRHGGSFLGVPAPPERRLPPHVTPRTAHPVPRPAVVVPPPVPVVPVAPPPPARPAPDPAKGSATGLPLPRYAALRSDQVNWRAGPGTRYPIDWIYQRRDLPVRVEREFEVWRLVSESDGTKGWVHQATLTGRRSLVVAGTVPQTLRAAANDTAPAVAILKPGVIGQVQHCAAGSDWCAVQVKSYQGYLNRANFWGTLPGEAVGP